MSGQPVRPGMTASQIIYANTIADGVRMTVDQYHVLPPGQSEVSALLTSVATVWMQEQQSLANHQPDSFNSLASPATCRVAATQEMRRQAHQTVARECGFAVSEPREAMTAKAMIEDTLLRLATGTGFRNEQSGPLQELMLFKYARNVTFADIARQQKLYGARDDDYARWWETVDLGDRAGKIQIPDTPDLRRELLADTMRAQMEWGVREMFRFSAKGENTAGRLLAGFEIALGNDHLSLHEPALSPEARSVRELQLAVRVMADDLQRPGGVFNTAALDYHQFRLNRLGLGVKVMSAEDYQRALDPALTHAAQVDRVLGQIVAQKEGRFATPEVTRTGSMLMPAPQRYQ